MSEVNDAIVQAVAATDKIVVGQAHAMSVGMVEQAQASSLGILMQNAVFAEKNLQTVASTMTATVCALIVVKGSNPAP